jgi:hypothetical protein
LEAFLFSEIEYSMLFDFLAAFLKGNLGHRSWPRKLLVFVPECELNNIHIKWIFNQGKNKLNDCG